MAESTAQRVRVGPLAVSVDKQKPLLGAKVSKGIVYAPWNATVNVGAFADLHQKQLSGFVRGEMDAGKFGVLVADVEGVEVQRDFTLQKGEGKIMSKWPEWARSTLSLSAGIGLQNESRGDGTLNFRPRPYLNVDLRPTDRNAKGAMISMNLVQNQPVDLRPSYKIDRNVSVEFPVTVTCHHSRKDDGAGVTRDDLFLNAHVHGLVMSYKMDNVKVGEDGESPLVAAMKKKSDGKKKK